MAYTGEVWAAGEGMVLDLSVLNCASLSLTGYAISRKSVLNSVHVLSSKQGVKLEGFVLNRVRVSNSPLLSFTKMLVDYPPPREYYITPRIWPSTPNSVLALILSHVVGQQVYEKKFVKLQ